MASHNCDVALKLARLGLPVFPCHAENSSYSRAKSPRIKGGFYAATTDVRQIKDWWSKWPDALVGLPTGSRTGLSVIDGDIDKKSGLFRGEQQIKELNLLHPLAIKVRTPSKGVHVYFADKVGVATSSKSISSHIDVRGNRGYVIAPETILPDGSAYTYENYSIYEALADDVLPQFPYEQLQKITTGFSDTPSQHEKASSVNIKSTLNGATETEKITFLKIALESVPNTLCREDWVKLGASLKVAFGDFLKDDFIKFSLRYTVGDCTSKEAVKVWNSLVPHTVNNIAPAFALLKDQMDEKQWTDLWRRVFEAREKKALHIEQQTLSNQTLRTSSDENNIDPVDLWNKFDPPDLPRGLLPNILEDFAILNGKQIGADPAGLAMAAIVACAVAIPDQVKLKVKQYDDWLESARIWCALVGPPSAKKSPIIDRATAPLSKLDSKMMENWLSRVRKYDALEPAEKKGKQRPKQTRLRLEDTTVEAAQQVLEGSPWGILMLQDELSGFFGAMDKYNGGKGAQADRAFWLRTFNGGPYAVNRVTRGAVIIPNASVSMLGGIQPEPIRKIAGDSVDDGLLQRLFPISLQTASAGVDEPMPPINKKYDDLVSWLSKLTPHGPLANGYWEYSTEAQRVRRALERKHLSLQSLESINRKLASHIGKYDGLFARLCIIWHFVEHFGVVETYGCKVDIPTQISGETAQRAANFLHEFLLPHALAFYSGVLALSDDHDRLQSLAGYILARKLEVVTNRDVQRGNRQMRGLKDHEIRGIFEQLEALGWLERVDSPKPSSPPHWHVNPEVHKKFEARAKEEGKRRDASRTMIQEIFRKQ